MVSPKVSYPAAILAVLGFAGLVAGALLDEPSLTEVGATLLAASGVTAGVGYSARDPRRR
jgi:hypothetical protein